jgi:hypothetical protein
MNGAVACKEAHTRRLIAARDAPNAQLTCGHCSLR